MNPSRISREFARLIDPAVDGRFADLPGVPAENSATVNLPRVVFSARFAPLKAGANRGLATVLIIVESMAGGSAEDAEAGPETDASTDGAAAHEARVNRVQDKFFGLDDATAQTVRSSIAEAITFNGNIEVQPRYVPVGDVLTEKIDDRFRTVMKLRAGVILKPVAV